MSPHTYKIHGQLWDLNFTPKSGNPKVGRECIRTLIFRFTPKGYSFRATDPWVIVVDAPNGEKYQVFWTKNKMVRSSDGRLFYGYQQMATELDDAELDAFIVIDDGDVW